MPQIYKKSRRSLTGFSLVEIIIAVFILAFLTVMVVVLLDPADFFTGARDTRRISDLQAIDSVLSVYRQDVGAFFPSSSVAADPSNAVIGLVRQDCTGYSNCFTSLSAWEAAYGGINFGACAQGDLVCANKSAVAKIDGAWTSPDIAPVTINGWTTGPNNYIKIYTTTSSRHPGKWDTNKYRLTNGILIHEDYVRIDGLQFGIAMSGNGAGVYISTLVSTTLSDIWISNNIIRTTSISGQWNRGINIEDGISRIWNNIIYGFTGSETYGINGWNTGGAKSYIYNNTVTNSYNGIHSGGNQTFYIKNNIVQDATYGYYNGTGSWGSGSDYNISNANDAVYLLGQTHSKTLTTVLFVSSSTSDFHLSPSDTAARGAGADLTNDPYLSFVDDIDKQFRGGSCNLWDIGADQVSMSQFVFVSLPDTSPVCSNYSLPFLDANWGYRCTPISTFQKASCTGWIPIDFSKIPGNILNSLPVDPNNLVESGQYYTFVTDGKKWELTSILESDKNKGAGNIGGKDGGQYVNILEIGSNLTLTPSIVKSRNQ